MSQTIKTITHNLLISSNTNKQYKVSSGQVYDINIVDIAKKNTNTSLTISLDQHATCSLHIYVLSNKFYKNIKITINHSSNAISNTIVKAFATNHGTVTLDLINITPKNTIKVTQDQSIDGILLDETAKITVTPSMLIDTNIVKASHAVNIGNVNPKQLFYLMSRGLTKTKATMMILNGMFDHLHQVENTQDLYNKVTTVLKQMIKGSHESK
jgi:Fe-S cluster assembly protein SufD